MTGTDTGTGAIDWGHVQRLLGAARPTRRWVDFALLGLFIAWLLLTGLPAALPDTSGVPGSLSADFWLMLVTYCLHLGGGLLNRGWRVLPVTPRERRAAAWALVSVVPLALALVVTLGDAAIAAAMGHAQGAMRTLTLFGARALAVECYALLAIGFGNWHSSVSHMWLISQSRQPRDWLMVALMCAIVGIMVLTGERVAAMPGSGLVMTVLAIALCAGLLPLALRVIRLDRQVREDGMLDALADWVQQSTGLRMTGWTGHFARQALNTGGLWLLMVGFFAGVQALVPPVATHDTSAAAFREGFRQGITFGATSTVLLMPTVAGTLLALMTQQYLLRARLMLLTLPRGDLLVLTTSAFNGALAFGATLVLVWPHVVAEPDWPIKLGLGALFGLAMIHVALAFNLGVTSFVGIMRNALLIGMVAGGSVGIAESMRQHDLRELAIMGAVAFVVLIGALALCRWQLRHTRGPYRPWPGSAGSWRAA